MAPVSEPVAAERLTVVPANEASCDDLDAIFGTTDYPGRCRCQRFKVVGWIWRDSTQEERAAALRAQTACSDPDAAATSGLARGAPSGLRGRRVRGGQPPHRPAGGHADRLQQRSDAR